MPAKHPVPEPKPADNNTETWPLGQAVSTQYIETDEKGQTKALAKLDVGVYRAIFEHRIVWANGLRRSTP